jgi:cardiolipin synthase
VNLEWLIQWDKALLIQLNGVHTAWLDPVIRITSGWINRCLSGILIFLAVAIVSGCSIRGATRDNDGIVIVDGTGELSKNDSERHVDKMLEQTDSETLTSMVTDISALSNTPLYKNNHVELLIDGPETYRSMLAAIEKAKHHIFMETYIFADDEAGGKFASLLARKSTEGITVKVIYDSLGSMESAEVFFSVMEESGIELIEFNQVNPIEGGNPFKLNNRDHRKLLVVDNEVAFTGGINLSSTYSSQSTGKPKPRPVDTGWRDTHVAIRGPAVQGFEEIFIKHWQALTEEPIQASPDLPFDESSGNELVAILTANGGDGEGSPIFAAYLDAMEVAQSQIWITQAYFAPDKNFMTLLQRAARRGVDVRILVPGLSDSKLVLNASRSRYKKLLEAGVRIYETRNDLLHAKTAVIDHVWSTVGSSNLDYRSFLHNSEINAFILGSGFATQMEEQFERDIKNSDEIITSDWQRRSLWSKLGEKLSWTIEYWL